MKKIILLLTLFLIITAISTAQSIDVNGVWKLTEIHDGDQTYPINMHINFKADGTIEISGAEVGTWSKNKNTFTINCSYLDVLQGENKIEKLNEAELKLVNAKGDTNSLLKMSLRKEQELNNKFTGEWLLKNIEKNGETIFVGEIVEFNKNGIFYIQDMVLGKWNYNKSSKNLIFDTKKLKGEHSILKHTKNKFILEDEGGKITFSKIDKEKITKENAESGIIGTWEFEKENASETLKLLTFKAPNEFTLVEKGGGMKSKSSGIWMFSKKDISLIIIGQIEKLRGLNKVISISNKELSVENNGIIYTVKKIAQNAVSIERLTFTDKDFYNENGEYKYYDNEEKLPWKDSYQMITNLTNVKYLVYNYSTLIEDTKTFDTKIFTAHVIANEEEQTLSIDNIFNGFDRYNLPDDTELPPNNYNYNKKLFPLEGDTFRVVGEEEITTPAGTFNCTVVEATERFDGRVKLWMINDKPGIIARVIKDNPKSFGYYNIYDLKEIK